jgi:hypothetical protein
MLVPLAVAIGDPLVTFHPFPGLQHCGPYPVTFRESIDLVPTTVEQDLAAFFLARGDETLDLVLCCGRYDRSTGDGGV